MKPSPQLMETRQRFLPVRPVSLRERMLRDPRLSPDERQQLSQFFEMVAARFHFEFRAKLERLKSLYEPVDPDRDTLPIEPPPADATAPREEMAQTFEQLLLDANYVEMPREEIVAWAGYQSRTGLVVEANLSDYAELQVFYRGMRHLHRDYRSRFAPWRWQSEVVHVFSRAALLVRLADDPQGLVYLRLFKNVVAEDLEMILPYVRIRMRLLDHMKIGSSVAGGVATASWKAFTAAILSRWVFLLLLFSFMGAFTRGVFSFFSSKTRYMQALTASLYFQNMANNSGALAHLVDSAEAEECKELWLAYFILYVERDRDFTERQLDQRVEEWFQTEFGLDVDFEVSDAVRKLREKELLIEHPISVAWPPVVGGVLKVTDLPASIRRLDEVWDNYYA